jgi:hypothetical protein
LFFRTAPGRYFLTDFLGDDRLPAEYRRPVKVRRRIRDLHRKLSLSFSAQDLSFGEGEVLKIDKKIITNLLDLGKYNYEYPKKANSDRIFLWSFASLFRKNEILTYRIGKYNAYVDSFFKKRSIGFSSLVSIDNEDMFSGKFKGIYKSGKQALCMDLSLNPNFLLPIHLDDEENFVNFFYFLNKNQPPTLLASLKFFVPQWYEPETKSLAINDIGWLNLNNRINNLEDFDPWSRSVYNTI